MKELISLIMRVIVLGGVYLTFAICALAIIGAIILLIKEKLYDIESRKKL